MLNIHHDVFPKYIFSRLDNKNLCNIAFCCKKMTEIAGPEIIKRAYENIHYIQAATVFNKKAFLYLFRSRKKIEETFSKFEKMINDKCFSTFSPLDFFPYCNQQLIEELQKISRESFNSLSFIEKKEHFYSQFDCEESLKPHCINLIRELELKKMDKNIYININKPLSVGNIACFLIIKEQLKRVGKQLLFLDCLQDYHNNRGHRSIILFSDSDPPEQGVLSEELLSQLENKISSLKELRLLEITLNSKEYFPRMRTSFTHLLSGARTLPNLKWLYCHIPHTMSGEHIEDIIEYVHERLVEKQRSLDQLVIFCNDISPVEINHFVDSLDKILDKAAQNSIIFCVQILYKTCRHTIPKNSDQVFSTENVTVRITFQI